MTPEKTQNADAQLERAIGVPGLSANIINTTIGASIFALPALIAQSLGAAAPLAFIACGVAMTLFVTCFALAGSRVAATGGLYAYVEIDRLLERWFTIDKAEYCGDDSIFVVASRPA